jgi:hypothetical protein
MPHSYGIQLYGAKINVVMYLKLADREMPRFNFLLNYGLLLDFLLLLHC